MYLLTEDKRLQGFRYLDRESDRIKYVAYCKMQGFKKLRKIGGKLFEVIVENYSLKFECESEYERDRWCYWIKVVCGKRQKK